MGPCVVVGLGLAGEDLEFGSGRLSLIGLAAPQWIAATLDAWAVLGVKVVGAR